MVLQCNIYVTNASNYFSINAKLMRNRKKDENCVGIFKNHIHDKINVKPMKCDEVITTVCSLDIQVYPYV